MFFLLEFLTLRVKMYFLYSSGARQWLVGYMGKSGTIGFILNGPWVPGSGLAAGNGFQYSTLFCLAGLSEGRNAPKMD